VQPLREDFEKLKSVPSKKLDDFFEKEHQSVFEKTNCLECANCCKNYSPIIEPNEISDLMKNMGVLPDVFWKEYVEMDQDGDFVFKSQPCPNLDLDTNYCKIYENRPRACREYPHTNHKKMNAHLDLLQLNIEICPAASQIVQNIIDKIS
jgi:Fe-S-cluster containining protein